MAGETILVVEDNPMNMELVSDILEAHGYQIMQAINGNDAISLVQEKTPDLILMDIQLPGLDGLTVTGIIKDNPDTRGILIIALTARAMQGDEEKARMAGCDGYISKPINTRTFPTTVRNLLDEKDPPA
ncbi:MAG: response regulator [bacterium]|nr:response regulator [bacterium]